jgi:hypothetical protein
MNDNREEHSLCNPLHMQGAHSDIIKLKNTGRNQGKKKLHPVHSVFKTILKPIQSASFNWHHPTQSAIITCPFFSQTRSNFSPREHMSAPEDILGCRD